MEHSFTYDAISAAYSDLVQQDPSKQYVQYPWALAQVPADVRGVRILDIGCGEGSVARALARMGAVVCGYDNSIVQIGHAQAAEDKSPLGIEYIHADPVDVVEKAPDLPFDVAISVAVLHYAKDHTHLEAFFSSTYKLVKPGARFAALVMNPEFKRFGMVVYNRRYSRQSDGQLCAEFFDGTGVRCSALYSDFTRADFEHAATHAGWKDFVWCPIKVTDAGKIKLGHFWDGFEEDCLYASFTVVKPAE